MQLGTGSFHTSPDKPLFGALDDSAPDRWGRLLMRRAERKNAEKEQRTPRALKELDFLLMVDDEARQGALRFKTGVPRFWISDFYIFLAVNDLRKLIVVCGHQINFLKSFTVKKMTKSQSKNTELPLKERNKGLF